MGERVVVAMSGGVDSSLTAAILKNEGYDVIGLSMQLWDSSEVEDASGSTAGSCCSIEDLEDARLVADRLGIPYYVLNMEEVFSKEVVDYFVRSYMEGETPNPCTKCNQEMKFKLLLRKARELDARFLATGHYARVVAPKAGGAYRLLRGVDTNKDQSYFLFTMNQAELASVLFPLGAFTKSEVRAMASGLGLRTADKAESQEICFVTEGSYADFVADRVGALGAPGRAGSITDSAGKVLGAHKGLYRYTIGQRKGLNITAGTGPHYVTGMDMDTNQLIVGRREDLFSSGLVAREASWIDKAPEDGSRLNAVVRYRHSGVESRVSIEPGGRVKVSFDKPETAVSPGQAVVFYDRDEVVGGAWIEQVLK